MHHSTWLGTAGLLLVGLGPVSPAEAQNGPLPPVQQARELAFDGQREASLELLSTHLQSAPTDGEARTLYGTVLSWEGRFDDARTQLATVLHDNPTHADALPALANVELWSGHHQRAERLTAEGLEVHPWHNGMKITRARALWNLEDTGGALEMVEDVLQADPANETAEDLRRALRAARRQWRTGVTYRYDAFHGGRSSWQETRYSLGRQTPLGSVIGRVYRADRFGYTDHMFEIEMYPRFQPGFYAYVSAARSDQSALFPSYRFGTDVYKSVGGGFEASLGYRRLQFTQDVDIYVGSLTKYWRSWMYTGRAFVTPSDLGTSVSVHGTVRKYDGDGIGYVGVRYGRGRYRDEVRTIADILVLGSDTLAGELVKPLGAFELSLGATVSREGRAGRSDLWQIGVTTDVGYRF